MKAIATGMIAATLATASIAAEVTPYIVAERAIDAEENTVAFGTDVAVTDVLSISAEVETLDANDEARFEFEAASVDFGFDVRENVSLYLNNDFDRDWSHSESTIGVKVTF